MNKLQASKIRMIEINVSSDDLDVIVSGKKHVANTRSSMAIVHQSSTKAANLATHTKTLRNRAANLSRQPAIQNWSAA